ncbi:MAG: hypothetical protein CL691_01875 [Cellvibrionales bacterium]|nr:hypothetical protein [Cellvibrionales bacterium]|tara:strand:- start:12946 stop:13251 length:306 start_codon:yes stop_codon:yes gene_type:complete
MKTVKKNAEYTIYQKRNNRYAVKGANANWLNGEEKVDILLAENLIKLTQPAAPEVEEKAPADTAEDTAEETTEDTSAEVEPSADSNDDAESSEESDSDKVS